jgi:ATP-binding protein involved in chromosome partitioning
MSTSVDTAREQEVLAQLRTVQEPDLHKDLVTLGMIKNLKVDGNQVSLTLLLTTPAHPLRNDFREACRSAVASLPWVEAVNVGVMSETVSGRGLGAAQAELIPSVKNVVAVASGKGGVGKSTTSVNLALALAETGARVGLLDADIYGPNLPLMMGLKERPQLHGGEGAIQPIRRYGVKLMSIGFFLDENNPVIWRGPMVHGAIQQFLRDVDWGELDYLVVDLPPGTGDAPLSLSQLVPLSGVVMVTTPQDVALQDVSKGVGMFRRLEVPIVGIVENMSYFICSSCGTKHEIFGAGGGERIARHYGLPFLGKLPLQAAIRQGGDEGRPFILAYPQAPESDAYRVVAGELARQVALLAYEKGPGEGFVPLEGLM